MFIRFCGTLTLMKIQALLLSLVLVLFFSLLNCSDSNTGSSDNGGDLLGDPEAPVASGCPDAENPCCTDPATDVSLNACFASVTAQTLEPGFAPAQSGVLVHGWDGTEAAGTPWVPGQEQGPTKRWSSSYINRLNVSSGNPNSEGQNAPPTISIYSILSGGIILSPANTQISCAFAGDAGTDSRPPATGYPDGCGPKVSGEGGWCANCQFSDASESCAYSPIVGGASNGLCTIPTTKLSAMLKTQLVYTALAAGWTRLEMAYNEVVAEPLVQDSTDTIVAFYTPVGTDPRARACPDYKERPELQGTQSVCCPIDPYTRQRTDDPCTDNNAPDQRVTCDEMQALSEQVGVNVPLLLFNPTDLEQPFSEACANWSECSAPGAVCVPLVGS